MKLERGWALGLALVVILGLSGLIFGGRQTYKARPPVPDFVKDPTGTVLLSGKDILGGQAVFQKHALMDYGSVFGHGAYLGPDFTAEYLRKAVELIQDYYAEQEFSRPYSGLDPAQKASVRQRVVSEQKQNRYDPGSGTLVLTREQARAHEALRGYYREFFAKGDIKRRIPAGFIRDGASEGEGSGGAADAWLSSKPQTDQLTDFFFWTAWAASANRPGLDYSYTNNWPPDEIAGNKPVSSAILWSNVSAGMLLLGLGLVLFLYRRYSLGASEVAPSGEKRVLRAPAPTVESLPVTPSQRKAAKYFLVVSLLFLGQTLVGSLAAHYFVEESFFGLDLSRFLPFNLVRGWHLQLAVFWIATAWLGTGIFVAPLVGGKEPKGQALLVDFVFAAVLIVAVGSLAGEYLGVKGLLGKNWFLFGNQGWEYLELGRVWQALLLAGMLIWVFIVYRALRHRLAADESKGSLSHLLLYAAVTIPAFYAFGLLYNPGTNFTVADFWRWFVVHLWVEGMFEFFTVVVTSYLLVTLGLVGEASATRAVYFTLVLVFGTGLIGVGHHYYWIGAPAIWLAMGAVFSALEVVPLTLLILEAAEHHRLMKQAGTGFQYGSAMLFLIAVAVWNFLGAGVLGFIANMPIVNYYEHGTYLTPAHGHAAMMGVYGMLAVGLLVFSLRSLVKPQAWPEKLVVAAFWLLNAGLAMMLLLNLLPVGFLQLAESIRNGTYSARSFAFVESPLVHTLSWMRMPGDIVFIFGVLVLLLAVVKAQLNLRPVTSVKEGFRGKQTLRKKDISGRKVPHTPRPRRAPGTKS